MLGDIEMMGDAFYTDPYVTVLGAEITVVGDDIDREITMLEDMTLGGEVTLGEEIAYEEEQILIEEKKEFEETIVIKDEEITTSDMSFNNVVTEKKFSGNKVTNKNSSDKKPSGKKKVSEKNGIKKEITVKKERKISDKKLLERKVRVEEAEDKLSAIIDRIADETRDLSVSDKPKKTRRKAKAPGAPKKPPGEPKARFCATCGIGFTSGLALRVHRAAHARERNQCPLCDAVFCWNSNLSRHIRYKHTGHKPFTCDVCQAAFSESGNLIRHKKVHSDDKPYQCDICGARHREKFNLKRHKKTHERSTPRTTRPVTESNPRPVETMIIKCINNL